MAHPEIRDFHIDEDLEDVFHSQLKTLDMESNATSHSDIVGDHLPEWIIGVIIVITMLIIAFFAMIVTSVKKKRSGEGGNPSSLCDDLESGTVVSHGNGETFQVTSFVYAAENTESKEGADSCVACETIGDDETAELKCYRNPLFVEDDDLIKESGETHGRAAETNDIPSCTRSNTGDGEHLGTYRAGLGFGSDAVDEDVTTTTTTTTTTTPTATTTAIPRRSTKGSHHKHKNKSGLTKPKDVTEKRPDTDCDKKTKKRRKYFSKSEKVHKKDFPRRERSKSVPSAIETNLEVEPARDLLGTQSDRETGNAGSSKREDKEGFGSGRNLQLSDGGYCCNDSGIEVIAELHKSTETKDGDLDLIDSEAVTSRQVDDLEGDRQNINLQNNPNCSFTEKAVADNKALTSTDEVKETPMKKSTTETPTATVQNKHDGIRAVTVAEVTNGDLQKALSNSDQSQASLQSEKDPVLPATRDMPLVEDVLSYTESQNMVDQRSEREHLDNGSYNIGTLTDKPHAQNAGSPETFSVTSRDDETQKSMSINNERPEDGLTSVPGVDGCSQQPDVNGYCLTSADNDPDVTVNKDHVIEGLDQQRSSTNL